MCAPPPSVETLRHQSRAAGALLFACPEYNYSMSGALKNAIDWASRPPDQPFAGKFARDESARSIPQGLINGLADFGNPQILPGRSQSPSQQQRKPVHRVGF
jgi:hypothetical protein